MSLMNNISPYLKMILTLICGIIGSIVFIYINLPLPWLLGSIFITSILIRFEKFPIIKPNYIFSSPARIIIGVTIGSAFTPAILEQLDIYFYSLLLVIPYTVLTALIGMLYYWKYLNFDKRTAYFSSMPGGVIEMVILGEEMKANTAKITLVQSSRLLFIVLILPFIIQYIFQIDIAGNKLITAPLYTLDLKDMALLISVGFIGALLAKKLKIPAALLIGPMVLSILAFASGLIESKPPDEILKFVQVILGTTIGFTFKGVKIQEVIKTLVGTLGHFVILALISAIFIFLAYYLFEFPILSTLLAFSPGGQAEINLISILVVANIPYITLHHIVRLFIVMNLAPILAKKYL